MRLFYFSALGIVLIYIYFFYKKNFYNKYASYDFILKKKDEINKIIIKDNMVVKCYIDNEIYDCNISASDSVFKNESILKDYITDTFFERYQIYFIILFFLIFFSGFFYNKFKNDYYNAVETMFEVKSLSEDEKSKVYFKDIGGLHDAKKELNYITDYLKNPDKYQKSGIKIDKGILLYGPTGNGKTFLAKALSNESNSVFISMSGAEFVQLYVGSGSIKVKNLFSEIEENIKNGKSVVVFIDEIDALGGSREGAHSHEEYKKTLNQFLLMMDGFKNLEGYVIVGATNLPDSLDKAFLRRFTKKIFISNPNLKERKEIVKKILENYSSLNLNIDFLASIFYKFSSAEMVNVINNAMKIAVLDNRHAISLVDIIESFEEIQMGYKQTLEVSHEDKVATAYHEVGHLFNIYYSENNALKNKKFKIFTINIQPRTRSKGYVYYYSDNENSFNKEDYLNLISVAFGGRAAEELFLKSTTWGCISDLNNATQLAKEMVYNLGWGSSNAHYVLPYYNEQFRSPVMSEKNLSKMDEDVQKILNEAYQDSLHVLKKKENIIHAFVKLLVEFEVFYLDEITYIFEELEKDSSDAKVKELIEIFNKRLLLSPELRLFI